MEYATPTDIKFPLFPEEEKLKLSGSEDDYKKLVVKTGPRTKKLGWDISSEEKNNKKKKEIEKLKKQQIVPCKYYLSRVDQDNNVYEEDLKTVFDNIGLRKVKVVVDGDVRKMVVEGEEEEIEISDEVKKHSHIKIIGKCSGRNITPPKKNKRYNYKTYDHCSRCNIWLPKSDHLQRCPNPDCHQIMRTRPRSRQKK